jgi:hypothetical protein
VCWLVHAPYHCCSQSQLARLYKALKVCVAQGQQGILYHVSSKQIQIDEQDKPQSNRKKHKAFSDPCIATVSSNWAECHCAVRTSTGVTCTVAPITHACRRYTLVLLGTVVFLTLHFQYKYLYVLVHLDSMQLSNLTYIEIACQQLRTRAWNTTGMAHR